MKTYGDTPGSMPDALVVDEDARSARHLREPLERMGVRVRTARSVEEAVALSDAQPPQLLIMTLPILDPRSGLELAAASHARNGTACVLVLDRVETSTLQQASLIGVANVLCKPVHGEQLEATYRLAFDRRDSDRRATSGGIAPHQLTLEDALGRIAELLAHADSPASSRS